MKTAILLGAGSSLPAGFPSTRCLTHRVVTGAGIERHSDGTYCLIESAAPTGGAVRLANGVARRLHAEAERYFSANGERPANYEDLFYLAKQALDEELGEMENPAIRSYVDELRADMPPLIDAANAENEWDDFNYLLAETCNYISDIVKILVEAGFLPSFRGFAGVGCNTRRPGGAERAALSLPVSSLDFRGERLRRRLPSGCFVYATVATHGRLRRS